MIKNVGSNWIVTVVTVVAVYFLTPFTIHKLGDAGYGTWSLINSITGYLGLLVAGVPMASVRYFAQHVANGDTRKLNQAIEMGRRSIPGQERPSFLEVEGACRGGGAAQAPAVAA